MAPKEDSNQINGVDLDVLNGTVNAVASDKELGHCKFRARNKWINSGKNMSIVSGFYAAKEEIPHKQTFELVADEPEMLAGSDEGANPVEHLLHALASCVTTSMVAHAAVRGIHIEELESELEGDIDLSGFFGLSENVPKGYTAIRVKFRVKTDEENLDRLKELAAFSPVYNSLTHGVKIDIELERK